MLRKKNGYPEPSLFKPKNPQKYKGNPNNIWCRSNLELRFYLWLDTHVNVLEWGSEEIVIPYISPKDNRPHRYFPDAWAKMQTKTGIQTYLVEIKPYSQTHLPRPQKRQTRKYLTEVMTFAINDAKWKSAQAFCQDKGWKWKVITEKELYGTKTK